MCTTERTLSSLDSCHYFAWETTKCFFVLRLTMLRLIYCPNFPTYTSKWGECSFVFKLFTFPSFSLKTQVFHHFFNHLKSWHETMRVYHAELSRHLVKLAKDPSGLHLDVYRLILFKDTPLTIAYSQSMTRKQRLGCSWKTPNGIPNSLYTEESYRNCCSCPPHSGLD